VRHTPNQTDSDVICSRSCDQGKITKRIERRSGLRKTGFKKRTNHLFFLIRFWKRNRLLFLKKNTQKPHSELLLLHHAISPFSELHNNESLYLLWHSNLRVKKCTPSLFRKVLLVNSLQSGNKAWQERVQQRKATTTQTLQFHVKFMYMLC